MKHEHTLYYYNRLIDMVSKEIVYLTAPDSTSDHSTDYTAGLLGEQICLKYRISIDDSEAIILVEQFNTSRNMASETKKSGLGTAGCAHMLNDSLNHISKRGITNFKVIGELTHSANGDDTHTVSILKTWASKFGLALEFNEDHPKNFCLQGDIGTTSVSIGNYYYEIELLRQQQEEALAEIASHEIQPTKKIEHRTSDIPDTENTLAAWFKGLFRK